MRVSAAKMVSRLLFCQERGLLILLLQDLFGDAKGLIRWYITKPVDHKVFIGDTMYDLNDPGALYDFMLTRTAELKGTAV